MLFARNDENNNNIIMTCEGEKLRIGYNIYI